MVMMIGQIFCVAVHFVYARLRAALTVALSAGRELSAC